MKNCLYCGEPKPLVAFSPLPKGRLGLHPWCRPCVKEYNRHRYQGLPTVQAAGRRTNSKIQRVAALDKRMKRDKDSIPGYRQAERVMYKLQKKGRVPKWLTLDHVLPIYEMAAIQPVSFTVDHIIPLHGKTVSGLHVPWNLQLLTQSENSRKAAKMPLTL